MRLQSASPLRCCIMARGTPRRSDRWGWCLLGRRMAPRRHIHVHIDPKFRVESFASRVRSKSHRRIEHANAFRALGTTAFARASWLVPRHTSAMEKRGSYSPEDCSRPTNGAVRCGSETSSSETKHAIQVQGEEWIVDSVWITCTTHGASNPG
ncbi:hypothetical protein EV363DRAFT_256246 [Boletus edulis]|nr:hypothetical protein EV363DRAFT_256246 [Boletus edulis]